MKQSLVRALVALWDALENVVAAIF